MRVLIDLTYILPNRTTGVANYAFRLLEGFVECDYLDSIIILVTSENREFILGCLPQYTTVTFDSRPIPYIRGILYKQKLNAIIQKENVDIFFSPYIAYSGLYATSVPFIGVFHDAQGFELMKNPVKQILYNFFTKQILNNVTQLVTISEYSKKDIQAKLPRFKRPITVIYNSIKTKNITMKQNIPHRIPYILNVNTLEPYKNLITLVKAFDLIKDLIPHQLIVKAATLPYWDEVIHPYLKKHNIENRVTLISKEFSDEEMIELYCNADLFVSPSLMEGFGYTPIEAALCHVPVVCSKESALYETTMGLLNYYEPATDAVALKDVILEVLGSANTKLEPIAQIYAKEYSPITQAQKFILLFKKYSERKYKKDEKNRCRNLVRR